MTQEFEVRDNLDLNGQVLSVEAKGKYYYFPGSPLEESEFQFDFEQLKVNSINCIGSSFFTPFFFINILEPALYEYIKNQSNR